MFALYRAMFAATAGPPARRFFRYVLTALLLPAAFAPTPPLPHNAVRIHYFRPDNDFGGWTMWTWNASTENQTQWCVTELNPAGADSFGAYWDVTVNKNAGDPPGDLGFIIHNCSLNAKDPGPDQHLQTQQIKEAWIISSDTTIHTTQPAAQQILDSMFQRSKAHWLDRQRLLINTGLLRSGWTYYLNASPTGSIQPTPSGITGGTAVQLSPGGTLTSDELTRYPQLANYSVLQLPSSISLTAIKQLLTGQLAISILDSSTLSIKYVTGVQIYGVLDDLYYYPGKLGVVLNDAGSPAVQIRLWAPTAKNVSLQLFDHAADSTPSSIVPMSLAGGVWTAIGNSTWIGKYYLYSVQVYVPADRRVETNVTTDPYSIDLALNGIKSRITHLDSTQTKPQGWDASQSPRLDAFNDLSIYELHIRDFSINDSTVPAQHRGMYLAFNDAQSNGMQHLQTLANSGLKAVHLLPSFHFGSVNEDKSTWQTTGELSQFAPDS